MAEAGRGRGQGQGGGWISFPFIIGSGALFALTAAGWMGNLIVYLTQKFNINKIDAAQIYSLVNGCINFLPLIAAIIADSFLGCFLVVSVSSIISFLGVVLLTLTSVINSWRPQPCSNTPCTGGTTISPTLNQYAVLYTAICLGTLGGAWCRFPLATMGANQFNEPTHRATFFNWFFFAKYVGFVVGTTVILYIQDVVSWDLGFGLLAGANLVGAVVFLSGSRFYYHQKPQGSSPFTALVRVVVASLKKQTFKLSTDPRDYYHGDDDHSDTGTSKSPAIPNITSLRFFNRAALITDKNTNPNDGATVTNPWRLCTVQQVEDLKTLIRISPLWSTSILLSTPVAVLSSMTTLQALATNRHLGPNFKIPAGSVLALVTISAAISLTLIDRFLDPILLKITTTTQKSASVRLLQRIGIGHVLTVLGIATAALVESKSLGHAEEAPMHVLWLSPQLILVGVGESFHLPGQVAFYYGEYPKGLKTSATAMTAMIVGIAYYLSTAVVHGVRKSSGWLKDDINEGRLDLVYWMLGVVGGANFVYFLICAKLYTYQAPHAYT